MTQRRSAILAIALSLVLVLAACGDDGTPGGDSAGEGAGEGGAGFTVTLTADAIEIPDEVAGGVVEVTLESDLDEAEVNFSQVAAGTTEEQFREAIARTVSGGPIPDFIQAETGVLGGEGGEGRATLILPEGEYIAWSETRGAEEGEEEGEGSATTTSMALEAEPPEEGGEGGEGEDAMSPDDFVTTSFTATQGEGGELPDVEAGQITARDYTFDIDVSAGGDEFVFRNEGPDQFHHVVLFNFGDIEASVVEENLPAFFESEEDAPPPPAFEDLDFENLEAGASTVLSPGLGTTAQGSFESGTTYAAVCFIGDKSGGPPHAIAHGMRTVFTVD